MIEMIIEEAGSTEKTKERGFYIDFSNITYIYPCRISKKVENFGVLERYRGRFYTLSEINNIIAEIIVKMPYIEGSMRLHISVMCNGSYHHILDIKNYNYHLQKPSDDKVIKFTA